MFENCTSNNAISYESCAQNECKILVHNRRCLCRFSVKLDVLEIFIVLNLSQAMFSKKQEKREGQYKISRFSEMIITAVKAGT